MTQQLNPRTTKASQLSWTRFIPSRSAGTTAVWLTGPVRTYQLVWRRQQFCIWNIMFWRAHHVQDLLPYTDMLNCSCWLCHVSVLKNRLKQELKRLFLGWYSSVYLHSGQVRVLTCCDFLQAKFRVELPGYPILGDGKGDNQNHAIPFMRGVFTQCIDANQGAYFDTWYGGDTTFICSKLAFICRFGGLILQVRVV